MSTLKLTKNALKKIAKGSLMYIASKVHPEYEDIIEDADKDELVDMLVNVNIYKYMNNILLENGSNALIKKRNGTTTPDFKINNEGFQRSLRLYEATEKWVPSKLTVFDFTKKIQVPLNKLLTKVLNEFNGAKVQLKAITEFVKVAVENGEMKNEKKKEMIINQIIDEQQNKPKKEIKKDTKYDADELWIITKTHTVLKSTIAKNIEEMILDMNHKLENEKFKNSGFVFNKILEFQVSIAQWIPLSGSSYVEIPDRLKNTKSIINVKNKDNKCFLWAIMRADYPKEKHPERITDLKNMLKNNPNLYNMDGIEYPVSQKSYKRFEKQNNKLINVFSYDESDYIYPLYLSKKPNDAIDLLLYNDHYCLIKNFNKLNSSKTKDEHKKYFCKNCFSHFKSQELLNNHYPLCLQNDFCKVKLPERGKDIVMYKNIKNTLRVPLSIHCDFECLTMNPNNNVEEEENNKKKEQKTVKYQKHVPYMFGLYVVSDYEDYQPKPIFYTGKDAHEVFLKELKKLAGPLTTLLSTPKPAIKTNKDITHYYKTHVCHICKGAIPKRGECDDDDEDEKIFQKLLKGTDEEDDEYIEKYNPLEEQLKKKWNNRKVWDHCHVTGRYRGPAHRLCNFKLKMSTHIPVIFHNLKGYDSHFIFQAANKYFENIEPIAINSEKYISFKMNNFRFIDSYAFMSDSLEVLTKNLKDSDVNKFKHTMKYFKDQKKFNLITQKGVCPYDYLDSLDKVNNKKLPSIEDFYSKLDGCDISKIDYQRAQRIWKIFKCKTLKDYLTVYLQSDIFCQADVFESFRETCYKNYQLDPLHYYTAPGLAWDAFLKKTEVKIELIKDVDIYLFFEEMKRGGISMISNRLGEGNNKYFKNYEKLKEENPDLVSKYIAYWDCNNLYGVAMSMMLPLKKFKWLTQDQMDNFDVTKIEPNSKTGYVLEVDLDYPDSLHDLHNDYPMAVESITPTKEMLSPYNKKNLTENSFLFTQCKKLIPNLMNKKKYILHYRNLQLYLQHGLKVTKVHRILSFTQSDFMKKYIDYNTEQRMKAKNTFEKDFYKLMINSVYGKTMENIRKRIDVKVVTNITQKDKCIKNPRYKSFTLWGQNQNYGLISLQKRQAILNKPIQIGACILDLSKVIMYDFHYNYIIPKYGRKQKLLFTDTDSLCYEIQTEDIFRDMINDHHKFDLSDFNLEFLQSVAPELSEEEITKIKMENKKVPGKFKLETLDHNVKQFVGLRSKLYSLLYEDDTDKKTCKGIKKCVKEKVIKHFDYLNTLLSGKTKSEKQCTFRSYKHEMYSIEVSKVALSAFNDKKYLLDDGIHGYSYGHCKIRN